MIKYLINFLGAQYNPMVDTLKNVGVTFKQYCLGHRIWKFDPVFPHGWQETNDLTLQCHLVVSGASATGTKSPGLGLDPRHSDVEARVANATMKVCLHHGSIMTAGVLSFTEHHILSAYESIPVHP